MTPHLPPVHGQRPAVPDYIAHSLLGDLCAIMTSCKVSSATIVHATIASYVASAPQARRVKHVIWRQAPRTRRVASC
ncbi:hypothetical protein BD414DRAFT_487081 [Trametes punicea]|nr:hypothetical protein BD414DRAFT_487081 [Trametes punicea]